MRTAIELYAQLTDTPVSVVIEQLKNGNLDVASGCAYLEV